MGKTAQAQSEKTVPEEKRENGQLPKNIRQVGTPESACRVYMEDYVCTFVKKMQEYAGSQMKAGILLGRTETVGTETCYFINGAILAEALCGENGEIQFTASVWKQIYEDIRTYFPQSAMQGWFLAGKEDRPLDLLSLEKVHRSAFSREESILCLCRGEETGFWVGRDSGLTELHGFYIYYERNGAMQEYMIGIGQSSPSEHITEESAVQNFRSIMEQKKGKAHSSGRMMRGVSIGMAAAVLFLAVNAWVQNRQETSVLSSESGSDGMVQAGADVGERETSRENSEQQTEHLGTLDGSLSQNHSEDHLSGERDPLHSSSENSSVADHSPGENPEESSAAENASLGEEHVPESSSSSDSVQAGAMTNYYEVKPGDTLVGISISFYGTLNMVDAICEANDIENPNAIYSGQKLRLP